ncbi:MAG TPA: FAD-dependent oxidoreductase, partial [Acidimicrobiales bacterium]
MTELTRRGFLAASTALAAGALAGCSTPSTAPVRHRAVHVPDPTAVAISRWASDPWARGFGSVIVPGADVATRALLATPLHDRLHLASEATAVGAPSSPDGSWAAGLLAAKRVLDAHGAGARVIVVGAGL